MRASSRLIPSIDLLWVNYRPKRSVSQLVERLTVEVYTKSIGRWFDSGCWDLHFFLLGGVHVPRFALRRKRGPTERTGTQSGSGILLGRGSFVRKPGLPWPWRRVLGTCGLRDETVTKSTKPPVCTRPPPMSRRRAVSPPRGSTY